jgi:hypothetical protein
MWIRIQDEGLLEHCIGVPPPWRGIMRRAAVLATMTSGHLPLGQEGAVVVPPPPPEGGAGGGAIEAP